MESYHCYNMESPVNLLAFYTYLACQYGQFALGPLNCVVPRYPRSKGNTTESFYHASINK
jgi:hypothetical protein